jgi:hypothetical protein
MKRLILSIALFTMIFSASATTGKPSLKLSASSKQVAHQFVLKSEKPNPQESTVTLTACGRTGTFTFSSQFTLGQVISICAAIIHEFCGTGPCA